MQIVGTSLGMFGPDLLDPELALSSETPLRNALFDVLLSLVEGGALDMRPTDDGLYAFRWRPDYAVAGLSPETSTSIDIEPPSPYLAELDEMRQERDEALGRAQLAEALAQERDRLLRLAEVPAPAPRPAKAGAPRKARVALDEQEESILDVLYASRATSAKPKPKATPKPRTKTKPNVSDVTDREAESASVDLVALEAESIEIEAIEIERVEADAIEIIVESDASQPQAAPAPAAARVTKSRTTTKAKPKPKVAAPKAAAPKVAAPKAAAAKATKPRAAKAKTAKAAELESNDVVYLTPPAADTELDDVVESHDNGHADDETTPRRAKWSGYTLDKPRMHLSSVDRIADEG
jgi:hypothetical protein